MGKRFQNLTINGNAIFVTTLIAPEDNPNGVIIRSLMGGSNISYGVKAPPSKDRFDRSLILVPNSMLLYNDLLIPAGNGVFMNTTADYVISVWMSWDVLGADGTVA